MIRSSARMALFFTFTCLVAGTVLADEVDNAPGSMCVGAGGTMTPNSAGQSENKTAATVTAICPSERRVVNGAFTTQYTARVWVSDQNSTSNVCCRAVSRTPNGNEVLGDQLCSSGVDSEVSLTLPTITQPYSFGTFFVRCTVPPIEGGKTSRILTYRSTQS